MQKVLSKADEALLLAQKKGYTIKNGVPHSYITNCIRSMLYDKGRPYFTIRDGKMSRKILVHRLVGLQKFGNQIFEQGLFVYHKNGEILDNTDDNICIGSMSEAQMSKKLEVRLASARAATPKKHDHKSIIEMHKKGMSYANIMQATGIKSKGTISFIIKKSEESCSA